jgi:hypothetical protein
MKSRVPLVSASEGLNLSEVVNNLSADAGTKSSAGIGHVF